MRTQHRVLGVAAVGILVAGGVNDVIERNLVYHQDVTGIGVIPLPEKIVSPSPKAKNFDALRNVVATWRPGASTTCCW